MTSLLLNSFPNIGGAVAHPADPPATSLHHIIDNVTVEVSGSKLTYFLALRHLVAE